MNANARTDILRQGGIPQPSSMLGMGNSPFMQNPAQGGQQQLGPLGMPPNANSANAPIGMLGGTPSNSLVNSQAQRYMMQPNSLQQQQHQHQRQMMLRNQGASALNPTVGSVSGPHIGGLTPNQLQSIGFTGNMMPQQGGGNVVRRVTSQPQLNPSGHMGNLPPGVPGGNIGMNMNPQNNVPAHMRQTHPPHPQVRMQPQTMQGMTPEMTMMINRQGGNPAIPQNMARSGSAQTQAMNSLAQPPSMGSVPHPPVMQSSHHQNNFSNSGPLATSHQPPQMSSSPRPGSLPPSHTPNMSMAIPGPSQTPVNRARMTPEGNNPMAFMNFQGPQFSQGNPNRLPTNNGQYPFVPSSTPPIQMTDISQPMPNLMNTPNSSNRPGFQLTPAQAYEMSAPSDTFNNSFGMHPPSGPPRPPSHNNHHPPLPQQQQTSQHSPHHSATLPQDQHGPHPQRPQSQPQNTPGRPPSQAGPSQPPHPPQPNFPSGPPLTATGKIPNPVTNPPGQQPPLQGGQHLPIAPRPPGAATMPPAQNSTAPTTQPPSDTPPTNPLTLSRPSNIPLGNGQGLIRVLQFSGMLSSENNLQKFQLSWWNDLIKDYFTPKAVMKFTLWKDNQRNEAKPFEIGVPILPRFFLVTTQSGVKSMTLSIDGARERMFAPGHSVVECVGAMWTYKYHNGYTVTLRGPLTVHVILTAQHPPSSTPSTQTPQSQYLLKFEEFQFDANFHDKYIALESITGPRSIEAPITPRTRNAPTPTSTGTITQQQQREEDKKWEEPRVLIEKASLPGEPVNAFGIPQATMRCLELAESVGAMADLIAFSNEAKLGPMDSLTQFARNLRDSQSLSSNIQPPMINGSNSSIISHLSHPFHPFPTTNGVTASPAVTLYSNEPIYGTNSNEAPPPQSVNSPQNTPSSAVNSPQKQHKTITQSAQGSSSSTATSVTASSPTVSTGAATNTPALSNASLKRKQASETASPTTSNAEQPPHKRLTRTKRGRTQGGT